MIRLPHTTGLLIYTIEPCNDQAASRYRILICTIESCNGHATGLLICTIEPCNDQAASRYWTFDLYH